MLSVMVKEEGIFRPVRGMNAMAVGAGPAHAMYFTCIEMGREAANQAKVPTQFGEGMLLLYFTETCGAFSGNCSCSYNSSDDF